MVSRSSSIKICHMNLAEIYSLNSYFGILLHQSYTKLQSGCFHWTSLQSPRVGNSSEDHLPLLTLSPWLAAWPPAWALDPRGAGKPLSWPWGAMGFHYDPISDSPGQWKKESFWRHSPELLSWLTAWELYSLDHLDNHCSGDI